MEQTEIYRGCGKRNLGRINKLIENEQQASSHCMGK